MKITSVEKNKKNKNRLSVYIDGKYTFCISEDDYLALNLYEEKEMTLEDINLIKNEVIFRYVKNEAVKYISYKLRSEKDLYIKLEEDGYEKEIINLVINELRSIGYINDLIYAQKYIFDRNKLKPKSQKMLRYELQSKGISSGIVDNVMSNWEVEDVVVAESLVKRKFGKYSSKDEKVIKKIQSFLHHRGFDYEIIKNITDRIEFIL